MKRTTLNEKKTFNCILHGVDPTKEVKNEFTTKPRLGRMKLQKEKQERNPLFALLGDNSEKLILCPKTRLVDAKGVEYPERTDIHCCWDRYPIDTQPLGIPIALEVIGDLRIFHCTLVACSTECANAYYQEHRHNPIFRSTAHLLELLHNELQASQGKPLEALGTAQDWNLLKTVGQGDLDIIEYRKKSPTKYFALPTVRLVQAQQIYQKCRQ